MPKEKSIPRRSIAIIGGGYMGEAIIRGLVVSKFSTPGDIVLFDIDPERRQFLQKEYGVKVAASGRAAAAAATLILLAVKPNDMAKAMEEIAEAVAPGKLTVCVAAGVSTSFIENFLDGQPRVVRVMPNAPALIGKGAAAVCGGRFAKPEDEAFVMEMFESMGRVVKVEEKQMDAVTGLSGSGPAFAMVITEALADGGVKMGLPRDVALKLAAQTLLGAAEMVLQLEEHPASLRDRVTSPGGTTIAGLHAMEVGGIRGALMAAVEAATRRSQELGRGAKES